MGDTYFDRFCEIIDDYTILKESTAIGVMVDLKDCIKKIKSEVLLELQNKTDNRNDYIDFLINEIERRNFDNEANINYVQKWLDEYQISIQDIFNMNIGKNGIEHFIDRHYNDMDKYSQEKDKAYVLQLDFYFYFCKYYADELIEYLNSKKEIKTSDTPLKQEQPMKPFKDEYLNIFCKEISNEKVIKECCFISIYEGITHYEPYFETEVIENLLLLNNDKKDDYLNYAIDKIKKTPFAEKGKFNIDKWLEKYNVTVEEFPIFTNDELNHWLERYYNGYSDTPNDLQFILDIQIDFYCYAAMLEASKMIDFLESKKSNQTNIENREVANNKNQIPTNSVDTKLYKDAYLEDFLKYISSTNYLYESCFYTTYSYELLPTVEKVIIEIEENLLTIPESKIDTYLNILIKKIQYFDIASKDETLIDRWLTKYNLHVSEFPFINNQEIKKLITISPTENYLDGKELFDLEDIQIDFFNYACSLGAQKIIDFLESKRSNSISKPMDINAEDTKKLKWIGKPSQLGLIIGKLAELGYIEAPSRTNGDTNYTQFARLVNNTFEVKTTEETLSKYLNLDSEKGQETVRKFDDYGFNIPHIKEVS